MTIAAQKFPRVERWDQEITITEKIDGVNVAIIIDPITEKTQKDPDDYSTRIGGLRVAAQVEDQIVALGEDLQGFASWVSAAAVDLVEALGEGVHFGEWWGSGIGRGYGLDDGDKRLALFDTSLRLDEAHAYLPEVTTVPVLYQGPFSTNAIESSLDWLHALGSFATPNFMDPEGIVIKHLRSGSMFKWTFDEANQRVTCA